MSLTFFAELDFIVEIDNILSIIQIDDIINITTPKGPAIMPAAGNITYDDVDAVRNLLEKMVFLLIEEQCSGMDFTKSHP